MLRELKNGLKRKAGYSLETIGDMAVIMESREKLKRMRRTMLLAGIPAAALQWFSVIFWIAKGVWWPFAVWAALAAALGFAASRYSFEHVKYICPECHEVFRPALREAVWARHTPTARKLTCTACGRRGFCVEVWGGDGK